METAVAAGVDRVQIRARDLEGRALLRHAHELAEAARRGAAAGGTSVELVVNRRFDVALAVGADGVHLGFDAVGPAEASGLADLWSEAETSARRAALLGASAHSVDEVAAAAAAGLDYVHLAPIDAPLSKAATRPALGLGVLAQACGHPIRVLAQGGVTAESAGGMLAAGAAGVAVSGAILMADDPGAATRRLRQAMDRAAT